MSIESDHIGARGFKSRFNVYQNLPVQGFANNVMNVVRLDLKQYDDMNEFDVATYRFIPKHAGWYYLSALITWSWINSIGFGRILLYRNATIITHFDNAQPAGVMHPISCLASCVTYLQPNDFVVVQGYQTNAGGGAINLFHFGNLYECHFCGHRLS